MSIVLVGSTSGSITLQEPAVAGTTVLDLPAVSGTILTTASSGQSIPKAALPTGSVLQVVSATYSTNTSNNTITFADTGLSASITPTSNTSKILILVSVNGILKFTGNSETACNLSLLRGSTGIVNQWSKYLGYTGSSAFNAVSSSLNYLDSPATTSSTTYKVQFASTVAGQAVDVQRDSATSTITLMEIAA